VILSCCKHKKIHAACFRTQNLNGTSVLCNHLKHFVKKDRITKDDTASSWKQPPVDTTKDLVCDLCDESLELKSTDSEKKNNIFKKEPLYGGVQSHPGFTVERL